MSPRLTWRFDGDDGIRAVTGERFVLWRQSLRGDTTHVVTIDQQPVAVSASERRLAQQDRETTLARAGVGTAPNLDLSRLPSHHAAHAAAEWLELRQETLDYVAELQDGGRLLLDHPLQGARTAEMRLDRRYA